jgi:hypothetical protein
MPELVEDMIDWVVDRSSFRTFSAVEETLPILVELLNQKWL